MIGIKLVFKLVYLLLLLLSSGWINTIKQNIALIAVKGYIKINGGSAATKLYVKIHKVFFYSEVPLDVQLEGLE